MALVTPSLPLCVENFPHPLMPFHIKGKALYTTDQHEAVMVMARGAYHTVSANVAISALFATVRGLILNPRSQK
jgi:hypothetical protein